MKATGSRPPALIVGVGDVKINAGDMIVLRYEGPKGGPGLPDVFKVPPIWSRSICMSSARSSQTARYPALQKARSSARSRRKRLSAAISRLWKEGDQIHLDLNNRKLELLVSDEELRSTPEGLGRVPAAQKSGMLTLYAKLALPATQGAGISLRIDE